MKYTYFLAVTWLFLFQSASAQTMKTINLEPGDKLINQGVNISIDFTNEKKPWCGLRVDWGNGKSQPVRVGHDGEEGAPTSPIKLSNVYNAAGKYNISLKGELLIRGLTGTATPCEVKATPLEVLVIDPETDTKYIEKSWTSYLGTLPTLHLQCIQVGLAASDIKYEARVESDQLVSMNAPGSKRVMERCQSFVKATHPKPNVACRVKGDMGLQESSCDQAYGQKMEDGAFRTITSEEAIKLHIQSKPWILGQRETPAGKEARLTSEIILREKEKQRILEAAMAERRLIKDQWVNYLSKINIVQLKCMQIGISELDIKYESLNDSDKLTSLTAPVAKQLTERCAAFGAAKHPQSNVACKINNGMGSQESSCDEYYAEKQQDGTFKKITLEEASRAQIQGKLWLVAQEENPTSQQARIANELVLREKEAQLMKELEEEKKLTLAKRERQKAAEIKAKKDSDEALPRIWKDAGFTLSRLPFCPLNGSFNDCFGSGKDTSDNEYIGEFKNDALLGKGIINFKNGDRYVGEFDNGKKNGQGIYYYLSEGNWKGSIFIGQYKGDFLSGDGIWFDKKGDVMQIGLYDGNGLIEYRYVDPATFTRIPAGKIPIISPDARLKIEAKQAEIAKEQVEKRRVAALAKKEAFTPNLSIVTGFPKFPDRPENGAYEMLQAEGSSPSTDRINLQIYSDGQAAFVSNGRIKFLMHTGNGIFVDQDTKLILDQKNSQLSINGLIVKGIQFVEKSPPAPRDTSSAYEDAGVKRLSYCAATYTMGIVIVPEKSKQMMRDKSDYAIKTAGRLTTRNSLSLDEGIRLGRLWFKEKSDYYMDILKNKYRNPDGSTGEGFFALVYRDDEDCNKFINSLP